MTLTPEDRERIYAEELERQRIRDELEAQKKQNIQLEINDAWKEKGLDTIGYKKSGIEPCPECMKPAKYQSGGENGCGCMILLCLLSIAFPPLLLVAVIGFAISLFSSKKKTYKCLYCDYKFSA